MIYIGRYMAEILYKTALNLSHSIMLNLLTPIFLCHDSSYIRLMKTAQARTLSGSDTLCYCMSCDYRVNAFKDLSFIHPFTFWRKRIYLMTLSCNDRTEPFVFQFIWTFGWIWIDFSWKENNAIPRHVMYCLTVHSLQAPAGGGSVCWL